MGRKGPITNSGRTTMPGTAGAQKTAVRNATPAIGSSANGGSGRVVGSSSTAPGGKGSQGAAVERATPAQQSTRAKGTEHDALKGMEHGAHPAHRAAASAACSPRMGSGGKGE